MSIFSRDKHDRNAAYLKGAWHDVIHLGEEELKRDPESIEILNDLVLPIM